MHQHLHLSVASVQYAALDPSILSVANPVSVAERGTQVTTRRYRRLRQTRGDLARLSVKTAPGIGYLLWASDDESLVP